jgi:hypothetical protein
VPIKLSHQVREWGGRGKRGGEERREWDRREKE